MGDSPRKVRGVGESTKQKVGRLVLGVDAREFPGGLLRLDPAFASLLPHDLCHGRSSSRWLPTVIEFQLSYYRSSLNMQYAGSRHIKMEKQMFINRCLLGHETQRDTEWTQISKSPPATLSHIRCRRLWWQLYSCERSSLFLNSSGS